jgi:hypothetical protein
MLCSQRIMSTSSVCALRFPLAHVGCQRASSLQCFQTHMLFSLRLSYYHQILPLALPFPHSGFTLLLFVLGISFPSPFIYEDKFLSDLCHHWLATAEASRGAGRSS